VVIVFPKLKRLIGPSLKTSFKKAGATPWIIICEQISRQIKLTGQKDLIFLKPGIHKGLQLGEMLEERFIPTTLSIFY
jgi:hypothetical protein